MSWSSLSLERGSLHLDCVPVLGGRVMQVTWDGMPLYWTSEGRAGQTVGRVPDADMHRVKEALGFPLWGGAGTWLAPQGAWPDGLPFLDLDSGPYEAERSEGAITMTSPVCRESGVRIVRRVALGEAPGMWTVTHRVENAGDVPVAWAPWSVAMLRRPESLSLPLAAASRHPDGVKVWHDVGTPSATRALTQRTDRDGASHLIAHPREGVEAKLGTDGPADARVVLPAPNGRRLHLRSRIASLSPPPSSPVPVPGPHGCTVEVYTSHRHPYVELEFLAPARQIPRGEAVAMTVTHRVWDST